MLNEEIADLIRDYARSKQEARDIRDQMMRFVVEDLGIPQPEAQKMDLPAFLDGYLTGRGIVPAYRKAG